MPNDGAGGESNAYSVLEKLIEKMGPTFVVMVTIGIGVFFFVESLNEARLQELTVLREERSRAEALAADQTKLAQERIAKAQDQILESYTKFGPFIENVISNVEAGVELQKKLALEVKNTREELQRAQVAKAEAERLKQVADLETRQARESLEAQSQQVAELRLDLDKKRLENEKANASLVEREKALADQKKELEKQKELLEKSKSQRSDQVAELRADLLRLAQAVRMGEGESAEQLALQAIDQDTTAPLRELDRFASVRSSQAADDMPSFIGRSMASLRNVAVQDENFPLWLQTVDEDQEAMVIAMQQDENFGVRDVLGFSFQDGRIQDTELWALSGFVARLPNPENWLVDETVWIAQEDEDDWNAEPVQEFETLGQSWSFPQLVELALLGEMQVWKGTPMAFPVASSNDLLNWAKKFPDRAEGAGLTPLLQMLRRSGSVNPNLALERGGIPNQLRPVVALLLDVANTRTISPELRDRINDYVSDGDVGRLAAMALLPDFSLRLFEPSGQEIDPSIMSVYIEAGATAPSRAIDETAFIRLARSGPDAPWMFDGLSVAPPVQQMSQMQLPPQIQRAGQAVPEPLPADVQPAAPGTAAE